VIRVKSNRLFCLKKKEVKMRINDFHNILVLVKQDILQSEAEYPNLLKVVGNNQRYDFRSQLSIYDRNFEAIACAKFDY
jgi:hypothetical protein